MNWLGDSRDRNPVQKDSSNEEFVYDRNAYYKYSSLNDRTGRAAPNFTATSPQRSRPTDSTGAMGPGEGNPYYKYKRLVDEDVRYAGKAAPTFSATDSARGVPSGVPPELGNSRFLKYKRLDEEVCVCCNIVRVTIYLLIFIFVMERIVAELCSLTLTAA